VISPYDGPLRPLFEGWGITVRLTQPYPTDTPGSYEGRLAELAQVVIAGGHTAALVNTLLPTVGADLCGRLGIPTVWAIHESFDPGLFWSYALGGAPVPSWLPVRLHQALGATAALVFEAEATRRLFTPAAGPGRAVVVPYGIDVAGLRRYAASTDRAAARRALGIAPGRRMALVMGTMDARKAQIRIAEGFALVAREHPDWDLVFVGGDDRPYTAALERFVDESDLADRVRVVPIVPDTSHWYRAADVMVSGSDVESLPRSALEAMGLGVPVLATAVFGLPELIEDGVTGFLVEPGDLQALVDGFRRVCSLSAGELAAVGDAARELIVAAYDSGGYAADIVALLEHLVDHPRADPSAFLAGRPPRGRRRGPTPAGPATAW
jgi:glycosyltransferase involved in cell wall biosynthesis